MFQHPEDTLARWRLVAAAWVIGILGACIAMAVAAPPASAMNPDQRSPSHVCIDPIDGRLSALPTLSIHRMPDTAASVEGWIDSIQA